MLKNHIKYILTLFLLHQYAGAQKIDNMASFRDAGDHYFRFNYDNDFFSSTDEYYTQGYSFELVAPFLKKNPVNHIFLLPKNNIAKFGLALEHIGFTPTSILSEDILYGDRPFAAAIMLKSFSISTDTIRKLRIASSFNIGIIGPGAFGGDMQTAIHRWTENPIPLGWQHQIKNDVVLNYELSIEKRLLHVDFFSVHTMTTTRIGTLYTNAAAGITGVFGITGDPFQTSDRKFKCYVYAQPVGTIVGYDATLQGGLINKSSPYTIASEDVERFTAQINFGAVISFKNLYFDYSRVKITREFESGKPAKWGGFKFGIKL